MKFNKQLLLRGLLHVFADLIIISSLLLVCYWVINPTATQIQFVSTLIFALAYMLLKTCVFGFFGIYKMITSNFGIVESVKIMVISAATSIIFYIPMYFIPEVIEIPISVFLLLAVLEAFLLAAERYVKRVLVLFSKGSKKINSIKRTLVIGAGAGGKLVLDESRTNKSLSNKIVVFVDDDSAKIGGIFSNVPVVGPVAHVSKFIKEYAIEEVIIAIADLDKASLFDILRFLEHDDVKIKRLPLMSELSKDSPRHIVDVDINELLGRDAVYLDNNEIHNFIIGKCVLVTGAGGSIGSELARQIFKFQPKKIILFDIYENGLYDVQQELVREMRRLSLSIPLEALIGSTYNEERVEQIFKKYRPELIFHAAAYKHVPLMEESPAEAIRTNIFGTFYVAKMADKYKAKKMVLVSTDKAVRPTNVMGATKAFAEMVIKHYASVSIITSFSAVRFGNVLGSNGSVIPLFKKQIEGGGPVTVTDANITRFFMTIPEAVGLILQSGAYATGGEIFILDMGHPIKIVNLAEKIIRQAGYTPYKDIKIEFIGLRPGEKLYEELLVDPTTQKRTPNAKIFIEENITSPSIEDEIKKLSKVFSMDDNYFIKDALAEIVTTYSIYKK